MRFTIDVKGAKTGWAVRLLDPATAGFMLDPRSQQPILPEPRVLQRSDHGFPMPPEGSPDLLPADLGPNLSDAYQNLMNHAAGARGVEAFGRYLFSTLIGKELWKKITNAADKEAIELALTWAADDLDLNRLPWEMMHHGETDSGHVYEGFLAAEPGVYITRRVAGTSAASHKVDFLQTPPHVLFVVGSTLTDPVIRPGAEYLGMLRSVERGDRYLYTHLLTDATTGSLAEAITRFRPTVVHIICHGLSSENGPSLEFRSNNDNTVPDSVTAARLLEVLRGTHHSPLPQVVVLNACSTATSDELSVGRPLAAALVEGGVPIVVGMSGRVSDQACRLFTRGFYQALLDGGEIADAAARGRRAAIAHGGYDPRDQIDWALPALFLAEAVGDARLRIEVNDDDLERQRVAMEFSKRPDYPVFCGRWEFFRLYSDLMSSRQFRFMAVHAQRSDTTNPFEPQPQYGSTRLLKELAAQATRDGHIPVLICKDWVGLKSWPGRLDAFLDVIVKAVNRTNQLLTGIKRHQTLQAAWDWKYVPTFKDLGTSVPAGVPQEFCKFGLTPEERLAKALMLDLLELRRIICEQRGQQEDADVKLLLLIDDYHQLVFGDTFFTLLGEHGMNDPRAADKVRCVITYNATAVESQAPTLESIKVWTNSRDVRPAPLTALHDDIDPQRPLNTPENFQLAALIYKQFLLHWRPQSEARESPLSINQQDDDPAVQHFITQLAFIARGVPSRLTQTGISAVIEYVVSNPQQVFLRKADDEDALRDLDLLLRKRGA